MAGNPGGGRKGWEDEQLRKKVLEKCWKFLDAAMSEGSVATYEQKLDIAKSIASKSMPTDINVNDPIPMVVFRANKQTVTVDNGSTTKTVSG